MVRSKFDRENSLTSVTATRSERVQPIILCGGSGSRLWPLSRTALPKQFLRLTGDETLFQLALRRMVDLGHSNLQVSPPLIVTGEEYRFLVMDQLRELDIEPSGVILEPAGKNTCPALTAAALAAVDSDDDPMIVVIPADQAVMNHAAYIEAIRVGIEQAANGEIVILGISPDKPSTGYGYIQVHPSDADIFEVRQFVEKPDIDVAQSYLDSGDYFWNAGIFVLRASVWLEALETFRPDIAKPTKEAWNNRETETKSDFPFTHLLDSYFMNIPAESIDCAVMERCPGSSYKLKMVPLDAGWSDLGTWDAVWSELPKDEKCNANRGDVLVADTRNTLAHATSRLVALVGVDNLVVIETPDAILVANKSRSQEVKDVVSMLSPSFIEQRHSHRKVYRPWGWYDSIDQGPRFKVKRIQVKPGASLSLQKHRYRAEHWIVVKGVAEVINGESRVTLTENQSTYVSPGSLHRLTNPGNAPLEIIEIQTGSYLGEDDIVRIDDNYGR